MQWKVLTRIKSKRLAERRKEIIRALFKSRGLKTSKQQKEFLNSKDPYRLTPKDVGISSVQLTKAVKRIKKAIKNKEKVIVYGDYDTDGVCATAIMWETLNKLGLEVMPYIPQREEGYGLKVDAIDQMVKDGVKLIITVDQGIVHSRQVSHAKKKGVEVIITDHHPSGKKKPRAVAIIHTIELAGAGVSWFLANWLVKKINARSGIGANVMAVSRRSRIVPGLDLVTIGTITDMVPLVGPNRSIVKFGLKAVSKTKRPGLLSLYQFAGIDKEKIDTYEVGYIIGPRINASGRMDDPMEALRLICTSDENRAISLAQKIDQKNRERQELMKQTAIHARDLWLKEDGKSALIFVYHKSYEHGVIGLVASSLKDEFYRPAVVLAPRKDHWVGSARSIDEFSIVEAIRELRDIIGDHGGHPKAAGFNVSPEKLEEVKRRLVERAEKSLDKSKLAPRIGIDAEIELNDLSLALYQQIEKFAPFGIGNPQPVFASRQVKIFNLKRVGADNQHLKLRITNHESRIKFEAIAFGKGELLAQLSWEKPIDIAYNLLLNKWNNQKRLELRVRDIKIAKDTSKS